MAKLLRVLLPVAGLLLAGAQDTASCVLDGAGAVDEALDAAVFTWASVRRCGKVGEVVHCEVDVTAAIESVNAMINVILKSISKCGELKLTNSKCGLAAGVLTRGVAGLASSAGGIIEDCPSPIQPKNSAHYQPNWQHSKHGKCFLDIADSFKAMFLTIHRLMTVKADCDVETPHECAHNAIKVVDAFASLGRYLAGAVGHCEVGDHMRTECAGQSLRLTNDINRVARASIALSDDCQVTPAQRLFLEEGDEDIDAGTTSSSSTFALAAMLPLTAVLSFAMGKRLATRAAVPTPDFEALQMEEQ